MAVRGIWADGVTVAAADLRLLTVLPYLAGDSPLTVRGGVRFTPGDPAAVTAAAGGLAVRVNPFVAVIAGTDSAIQAGYPLALDTQVTLPLTAASATYARKDLIVARVRDVGTAATTFTVEPVTGDASSFPVAPAVPPSCLPLAEVLVPAGAVAPSTIRDLRTWLLTPDAPRPAVTVDYTIAPDASTNSALWTPLAGPTGGFIAPASGKVLVSVSARMWVESSGWVAASARITGTSGYLRDPATFDTLRAHTLAAGPDGGQQATVTFPVTGLGPGLAYTAVFCARVNTVATVGHLADRRVLITPASS